MPARRKPADRLADRRASRVSGRLVPVANLADHREPPEPPAGLLKSDRERWAAFWRSDLAILVTEPDLPALGRLFELYSERARLFAYWRKGRFEYGSTKQLVLHPVQRELARLDALIPGLEASFGITPAARLRLGIVFGQARRSLEEISAETDARILASEEPDPRLAAPPP